MDLPAVPMDSLIKCEPVAEDDISLIKGLESFITEDYPYQFDKLYNVFSKLRQRSFINHSCRDALEKYLKIVYIKEQELVQHILYAPSPRSLFHDIEELKQFADILQKYTENSDSLMCRSFSSKLNYLFAVDGFWEDYKDYIRNLSVTLHNDTEMRGIQNLRSSSKDFLRQTFPPYILYVMAIRELHDLYQPTPQKIKDAVNGLFDESSNDVMTKYLKEFFMEENLEWMKNYIESHIIRESKLYQNNKSRYFNNIFEPPLIKCEPVEGLSDNLANWLLFHNNYTMNHIFNVFINLRKKLPIHCHCSNELKKIVKSIPIEKEKEWMDHILQDFRFHDVEELKQFADVLQKYTKEGPMRDALICKFNNIFAVDGFWQDYKDYVQNLSVSYTFKISIFGFLEDETLSKEQKLKLSTFHLYVSAIRHLHAVYQPTPDKIRDAVKGLWNDSTDEMTKRLRDFIGDDHLQRVKQYINEYVVKKSELLEELEENQVKKIKLDPELMVNKNE